MESWCFRIFKNDFGEPPTDADLDAIMDRSKMTKVPSPQANTVDMTAANDDDSNVEDGACPSSYGFSAKAKIASLPSANDDNIISKCNAPMSTSGGDLDLGGDLASTSAGVKVGSAGATCGFKKASALSFDTTKAPSSTFLFNGVDYKALREAGFKEGESDRDIASQVTRMKKPLQQHLQQLASAC